MKNISKLVHTISVLEFSTKEQDGTPIQKSQVDTPIPTKQVQGAIKIKRKEEKRTVESNLTIQPKEKLEIQTLVSLLANATPSSQELQRPSVEPTPLHSSRPSLS